MMVITEMGLDKVKSKVSFNKCCISLDLTVNVMCKERDE